RAGTKASRRAWRRQKWRSFHVSCARPKRSSLPVPNCGGASNVSLRTKAREFAMQMLFQWDMSQQDPAKLEAKFWKSAKGADKTREFANHAFRPLRNFAPRRVFDFPSVVVNPGEESTGDNHESRTLGLSRCARSGVCWFARGRRLRPGSNPPAAGCAERQERHSAGQEGP